MRPQLLGVPALGLSLALSRLDRPVEAAAQLAKADLLVQGLGTSLAFADWFAAARSEIALRAGNRAEALRLAEAERVGQADVQARIGTHVPPELAGKVTVGAEPLTAGIVRLYAEGAKTSDSAGILDASGHYEMMTKGKKGARRRCKVDRVSDNVACAERVAASATSP